MKAGPPLPFLKGTVDMLVLKALSGGPMHGFGIALWLEARSDGTLGLDDSVTYQVLHRLEGRGWVEAEWTVTENKRRARVYRLTRAGRAQLAKETDAWLRYSRSVTAIMTADLRPASA
ncbi:MAG TPA: PadR family transcriptional regulator [Gemmatimonadaceae bacterium]|nr:PadR family transcriptional regulator [Gemmatimonadaceae bacterium]